MKMFYYLGTQWCFVCSFCYFQGGRDQTLIPERITAKLSGTLNEVSQNLIYMKELYMSDKNLRGG